MLQSRLVPDLQGAADHGERISKDCRDLQPICTPLLRILSIYTQLPHFSSIHPMFLSSSARSIFSNRLRNAAQTMSTSTSTSTNPAFLLVGLPLNMGPPTPIQVAWSDKPVSIIQEAKDVTRIMKERGYDSFEIIG